MQTATELSDQIHQQALAAANRYRVNEGELIELLQQIQEHRVFLQRGYSNLFRYVVAELRLSESVAYNLIAVSRKAKEFPELKDKIASGEITLSNARKIVPLLTPENKAEWLQKAADCSARQLQKEVAKVRPQAATPERATYVSEDRVNLQYGLSEREMLRLRRVQDIVSQKKQRAVSLEETQIALMDDYLPRHDPQQKAKRQKVKKGLNPSKTDETLVTSPKTMQREAIPAQLRHQVNLRDQGGCAHVNQHGQRCPERRWLEIHHKIPVAQGGQNTLENLQTLCSAHHDWIHSGQG